MRSVVHKKQQLLLITDLGSDVRVELSREDILRVILVLVALLNALGGQTQCRLFVWAMVGWVTLPFFSSVI